jgi:hypothetical protein
MPRDQPWPSTWIWVQFLALTKMAAQVEKPGSLIPSEDTVAAIDDALQQVMKSTVRLQKPTDTSLIN